jgi:hypothetical protein
MTIIKILEAKFPHEICFHYKIKSYGQRRDSLQEQFT